MKLIITSIGTTKWFASCIIFDCFTMNYIALAIGVDVTQVTCKIVFVVSEWSVPGF